jgi:hypothetical protein
VGVTIASIFRDSVPQLDRYFLQVAKLEAALGEEVSLALCEGDSTDGTYDAIERHLVDHANTDMLVKVDHGGPKFGSVDHPQRWAQIALCCNAIMDGINPSGPVIYVESDLLWTPPVMERLLEDLSVYPAVAPMSMIRSGDGFRFYDVWGFRGTDGERFTPHAPYHPDLADGAPLAKIASAGSCIAMQPQVAKVVRFGDNDCVLGLGRDINRVASLWIDTRVQVEHP